MSQLQVSHFKMGYRMDLWCQGEEGFEALMVDFFATPPAPPPYRTNNPYVQPQYSHKDPGQLLVEDADEPGQVYIDLDIVVEDIDVTALD